jgi:4'-phosphopantetheinyl transferase
MELSVFDIGEMSEYDVFVLLATIDEQNRSRIQNIKNPESARLSLAAFLLARRAVAKLAGLSEQDILILRNEQSKPFVNLPNIHFSLSHCIPYAVCAADIHPVGVDIEHIRPIHSGVLKKICTEEELLSFFGHPPVSEDFSNKTELQTQAFLQHFYALWCLKESYAKLCGKGLLASSKDISVTIEGQQVFSNRSDIRFSIDYDRLPGYVIATATQLSENLMQGT